MITISSSQCTSQRLLAATLNCGSRKRPIACTIRVVLSSAYPHLGFICHCVEILLSTIHHIVFSCRCTYTTELLLWLIIFRHHYEIRQPCFAMSPSTLRHNHPIQILKHPLLLTVQLLKSLQLHLWLTLLLKLIEIASDFLGSFYYFHWHMLLILRV